ncbi:MAG TPA: hypothetical protein VE641_03055 [Chthoniobacterales bacterium]|nr:hypothetical protein [Chthoniobacterales bacterium]
MKLISRIWTQSTGLSLWKSSLLIFATALVIRLALIVIAHPYRDLSRYELERTALSLSRTGVFGNPYAIPTGPTAHVSPGYTVLLATVFHLFGEGVRAEIIKEVISSTVTSFGFALLPFAADRLFGSATIGVFAGLICALFPWKPMVQIDGDWETPYIALFLTVLIPITVELWRNKNFNWQRAVMHGLLWGCALLFASVLLPLAFILAAVGLWFSRRIAIGRYLRFVTIELIVVGLCLAPWILRNERALGAPIATRSNLGLELRVSNNNDATSDQRANLLLGVYDKYHPLQNVAEAKRVRELGEVAYNKWANAQTMDWIRSHPKRFVALTIGRIKDFWLYPDPSKLKAAFGDLTAILGLIGLIQIWQHDKISGAVVTSALLIYPAPSYLIHVGARQRFPVDWLLVLLSVAAVSIYLRRVSAGKARSARR